MVRYLQRETEGMAKKKTTRSVGNAETREKLKHTPFTKAEELKKASQEIRQKTWEQLEKAKIFNELADKPEYDFIKKEFLEGLKCKYGASPEHLVKVYSEGLGIEVDINQDLVKDIPHSGAFVETLIRSLGDTFSKSYYQAKGIIPSADASIEDIVKAIQKAAK